MEIELNTITILRIIANCLPRRFVLCVVRRVWIESVIGREGMNTTEGGRVPISNIIDRFAMAGRVADIDKLIKETRHYENLHKEKHRCPAINAGHQCSKCEGHLDFHQVIYGNGEASLWRNVG